MVGEDTHEGTEDHPDIVVENETALTEQPITETIDEPVVNDPKSPDPEPVVDNPETTKPVSEVAAETDTEVIQPTPDN